jgi:hypothetical protein
MKIRHTCACVLAASGILSFAGCSLWGPESRGEAQSESTLEGQSKSLAGVYRDIGSDGSIKPHLESVGTDGRIDGLIILGGSADIPDIKTGRSTIKGSMGQTTPKVKMGETTFPSESSSK